MSDKQYSKERDLKISKAMIGNTNGRFRKNVKHSDKTKKKISESKKGTTSHRKGITLEQEYGKERADKIRKKYIQNAINTLNKLKKTKISKAELILKKHFEQNNIKHIHQWKYELGVADFYLPQMNIVIECDGIYWHSKPDYIKRDKKQRDFLQNNGYNVLSLSSEKIVENGGMYLCQGG